LTSLWILCVNIKDIFIEKDGNEVRYIPPVEIDRAEVEFESYFENYIEIDEICKLQNEIEEQIQFIQ
jgi:hypothetical protein